MQVARLSMIAAVLTMVLTLPVVAGGPQPSARRHVLGQCPDGAPCEADVNGHALPCLSRGSQCNCLSEECRVVSSGVFGGELTISLTDHGCPDLSDGPASMATLSLDGRSAGGTPFTAATNVDFCKVDVHAACDVDIHTTPFFCTTCPESRMTESLLPPPEWLTLHPFPADMSAQILGQLPGATGDPIIAHAEPCGTVEGVADSNDGDATLRHYCIKGWLAHRPVREKPCGSGERCIAGTIPPRGGKLKGRTVGGDPYGVLEGSGACTIPPAKSGRSPERLYDWTPSRSGLAVISTCGRTTNFETLLYVREGSCSDSGLPGQADVVCSWDQYQKCGADCTGFPTRAEFQVESGKPYCVVVDGVNGSAGYFDLNVSFCAKRDLAADGASCSTFEECDFTAAATLDSGSSLPTIVHDGQSVGACACPTDFCGDGELDPGEQCDDGNHNSGDGCDALCVLETGLRCQSTVPDPFDDPMLGNDFSCFDESGATCSTCRDRTGPPSSCGPICSPEPVHECLEPAKEGAARLVLSDATPDGQVPDARNSFIWKWGQEKEPLYLYQSVLRDFGDVTHGDSLALCVYDGNSTPVLQALFPAESRCENPPCWSRTANGYGFGNAPLEPVGIGRAAISSRKGAGAILLRGHDVAIASPSLDSLVPPFRVQLQAFTDRSDGPRCWEATFSHPPGNKSRYKSKSDAPSRRR